MRRALGRAIQWAGRAIGGRNVVSQPRPRAAEREDLSWRRWEAAETTRLNRAQWQGARDQSLNSDLLDKLAPLRARTALEISRNPIVEGAVGMYCTDVAGPGGPTLQVQSDDPDYNDALEAVWREFFKKPDVAGKLSGVDWIGLCVRGLWTNGEFVTQKVTSDEPAPGPVSLRLKTIHPRRLDTPGELAGDPFVTMGVRQTPQGRPVEYFVADPMPFGWFWLSAPTFTAVRAEHLMHRFLVIEEDQVRGVPWLATSLQSVADLREFDVQVLDAARQAADQAVHLYTDHPDAPYFEINESTEIERRTISTLPPGWKPAMLQPSQPGPNYLEYRAERHRDVGRPVQMPGMMVRLDSSKHNYSSARFDGQIYVRGLKKVQGWLERRTLNELLDDVAREAELYALANPQWEHAAALRRRPRRVEYQWTWPVPPHVDRQKEANGERIELENGTLAFADACGNNGTDEDTQIRKLKRTIDKFKKAGVPLPAALAGVATPGPELAAQIAAQEAAEKAAEDEGDEDGDDDASKPKPKPKANQDDQ